VAVNLDLTKLNKKMDKLTQEQKIVRIMIMKHANQEWFYAPDFMKPDLGDLFVGYEASARLSDLTRDYPYMFVEEKRGKYLYRRFRFDNMVEILEKLPDEMRDFVMNECRLWQPFSKNER